MQTYGTPRDKDNGMEVSTELSDSKDTPRRKAISTASNAHKPQQQT